MNDELSFINKNCKFLYMYCALLCQRKECGLREEDLGKGTEKATKFVFLKRRFTGYRHQRMYLKHL